MRVKPQKILDIGLGVTTRVISRYAEAHPCEHTIVEHSRDWAAQFARGFTLSASSTITFLNLTETEYGGDAHVLSYRGFAEALGGRKFHLISIDGPYGDKADRFSRVDVLSILPECLEKDFAILMDDCNRAAERHTAEAIKARLTECGIECVV